MIKKRTKTNLSFPSDDGKKKEMYQCELLHKMMEDV